MGETCVKCVLVSSLATLSCIASVFMLVSIFLFKMHRKMSGRLILGLCIADFLQAIGIQISYHWINGGPQLVGPCEFQAWLINFSDVASSFWAAAICVHTVSYGVFNKKLPHFDIYSAVFCFGLPFLLSTTGFGVNDREGQSFYFPSGPWCWIGTKFGDFRIGYHYGFIFAIFILELALYTLMAYKVWKISQISLESQKNHQKKRLRNLMQKMAGYPIVFMIVFLPIACDRIARVAGRTPPDGYLTVAVCFLASNGLWNAVLYGTTRQIIPRYGALLRNQLVTTSGVSNSAALHEGSSVQTDSNLPSKVVSRENDSFTEMSDKV